MLQSSISICWLGEVEEELGMLACKCREERLRLRKEFLGGVRRSGDVSGGGKIGWLEGIGLY